MPGKLPDLSQSLQKADPGFLRIVFELWGVEPGQSEGGRTAGRDILLEHIPSLLEAGRVVELVESLPGEARQGLDDLLRNQGRLPWPIFTRRYGAVREMGAGRRDRLQPHQNPASPAEVLWYRALVRRDFLDAPDGPQEFAYIPSDLLERLPGPRHDQGAPSGRPASPSERAHVITASDRILDHACTLLAALRLGLALESAEFTRASWDYSLLSNPFPSTLQALLVAAELLESTGLPQPEPTRRFLELPRGKALGYLARAWQHSA